MRYDPPTVSPSAPAEVDIAASEGESGARRSARRPRWRVEVTDEHVVIAIRQHVTYMKLLRGLSTIAFSVAFVLAFVVAAAVSGVEELSGRARGPSEPPFVMVAVALAIVLWMTIRFSFPLGFACIVASERCEIGESYVDVRRNFFPRSFHVHRRGGRRGDVGFPRQSGVERWFHGHVDARGAGTLLVGADGFHTFSLGFLLEDDEAIALLRELEAKVAGSGWARTVRVFMTRSA